MNLKQVLEDVLASVGGLPSVPVLELKVKFLGGQKLKLIFGPEAGMMPAPAPPAEATAQPPPRVPVLPRRGKATAEAEANGVPAP